MRAFLGLLALLIGLLGGTRAGAADIAVFSGDGSPPKMYLQDGANRVFPFKTLADLKGKRLGMVRGASYGEDFEKAQAAGVFLVDGDSGVQNRLNKLMLGRIDCALFNVGKAGFEEALRINQVLASLKDKLVVLPVPLRKDPNFLAFPKAMHMKAWLAEFDQVVKNGYAHGEIQKIIARNLGP